MKCKGAIYRSLNSLEAKQPLQATVVASKGRVSKAGLAVLNKELYGHIYSCRKTLRRLLTFGSQAVCASSFTIFLFLSLSDLSFSLLFFSFNISSSLTSTRAFLWCVIFLYSLRSPDTYK